MMRKAFGLAIGFGHFVGALLRDRRLIMELARRECRNRYLGSAFGLAPSPYQAANVTLLSETAPDSATRTRLSEG